MIDPLAHGTTDVAVGLALGDDLAFVGLGAAGAHTDEALGVSVDEIDLQRHQRRALELC